MARDIIFAALFFCLGVIFAFWGAYRIGKAAQKQDQLPNEAQWAIREAKPEERMDWLRTGRLPK